MPSQKKAPFILGTAQITPAPARNLGNFFTFSQSENVFVLHCLHLSKNGNLIVGHLCPNHTHTHPPPLPPIWAMSKKQMTLRFSLSAKEIN